MRIGFEASILDASTRHSGIGRYTFRLLCAMSALEPDHDYLLLGAPGSSRPPDLPSELAWEAPPRLPLGKLSALATYLWLVPRLARKHQLDVLHVPTVHPRPSWPCVPRNLPCPLVVTLHDLFPLTFYGRLAPALPLRQRLFYRWNLRAATRAANLLTVSEASRREIVQELGVEEERVQVIYNGVDVAPGVCLPDSGGQYILFVGSYEVRKNLRLVLRAFARSLRRGLSLPLVVVADPASGPAGELQREVRSLGLEDSVSFQHGVPDGRLWRLYRSAALFVFPSLAEGFGFPPLEAMATGAPVIASDLPALREVLGEHARYVAPDDEAGLASALLDLARDPGLRRRMSAGGKTRAARFTWEECARRTLDVYRGVAGERVATAPVGAAAAERPAAAAKTITTAGRERAG